MREAGAVLLSDLMTDQDREELGSNALLTVSSTFHLSLTLYTADTYGRMQDWLGLVEKLVIAQSAFFFGAQLSSFSGGIINERVNLGKGWQTVATG